jgi:hypothetical protein
MHARAAISLIPMHSLIILIALYYPTPTIRMLYCFLTLAKIHHKEEVVTLLQQHNISIITIPPNMTDLYQPLDVKIFGPVKSSTHAAVTGLRRNSKTHVVNYTHTIEQFYRAYQRIPRQTIVSAFKQGANI